MKTTFKWWGILLVISLPITSFTFQNESNGQQLFEKYLKTFKSQTLPFIVDRKSMFNLSKVVYDTIKRTYIPNIYSEFDPQYTIFIPNEIRFNNPKNEFRCLFVLPSVNQITPVIISMDGFQDNEQNTLSLFLITYNRDGKILGSYLIGGYTIDVSEKFFEISHDCIITWNYKFLNNPGNSSPSLFYLLETQETLKIDSTGTITKIKETSRKGYFEGNWKGYFYLKS